MVLIDYENVEIRKGENLILKDITFQQEDGEFLYVIGKVGSGKSSLLKTIYCEIPVKKGYAQVFEYDLRRIKRKQIPYLRRKVGIVFQDFQLLTDRSVYENLRFVLKATGWKSKDDIKTRIHEVLKKVDLECKDYKFPHELSGGEQQRIVIARALLNSPDLILADEPTGNLDPETGAQIVKLLHEICESGTSIIMTTHNYQWVQDFPAKVKKCEGGKLLAIG